MPLPDVDILKSLGPDPMFESHPAIHFPEQYGNPSPNSDAGEAPTIDPFLTLPPNFSDNKEYANTPHYYQPKDIPNRYNRFILGRDNESINADIQSGWDRIGNASKNLIYKTGAYLAQTAGFIGGAIPALIGGTANLLSDSGKVVNDGNAVSLMTDNFLTRLGDDLKESVQNTNPIYKSAKYTDGNVWQKLSTTSWWLDDAIDRVALTFATVIPGFLEAKGVGLFGAVAKGETLEATGIGSKVLQTLADNPEMYGQIGKIMGNNIYKTAAEGVADIIPSKALQFKGIVQAAQRAELYSWNVIGQSALNGREAQIGIRKALQEQRDAGYNEFTDDQIANKAAEGAAKGFWYTVPLSLAASLYELPQVFSTAKTGVSFLKRLGDITSTDGFVAGVQELAKSSVRPSTLKILGKTALTGLEHGQNESAQVAIGRYLQDSIAGNTKTGTVHKDDGNPFVSVFKDWLDNVNDPNGQNNIALGTIQGALMTLFGHAHRTFTKEYVKQDEANKRYTDLVTSAIAQRRYFMSPEDMIEKDPVTNKPIIVDGKPKFNQKRLADMGLSQADAAVDYEKRAQAVRDGDTLTLDMLNHKSLANLAEPFFQDAKGMEYLTSILKFEAKNQTTSPDRVNDERAGIEVTPQLQLQDNLAIVNKLKQAHDAIENRHAGFTQLDVNYKDKAEVAMHDEFIRDKKYAQYTNSSQQLFLNNRLAKNNTELVTLGVSDLVEHPTNPLEERANDLIHENTHLNNYLSDTKEQYKTLIDKKKFKQAWEQRKTSTEEAVVNATERPTTAIVTQNAGDATTDKELKIGQPYSLDETLLRDKNELHLSPKITVNTPAIGGTHQVTLPNGKVGYLTPEEFKKYNISDKDNTDIALSKIMDRSIDDVVQADKFSDIKVPRTDKLAYINSLDNKALVDAVEAGFNLNAKRLIEDRVKTIAQREALLKNKEELDKAQKVLELNSGNVATNDIETDKTSGPFEEMKKSAPILFISSTTKSEDWSTVAAPHIVRSRVFLNNVKNFPNKENVRAILITPNNEASLGLAGLSQLSYGLNDMSDSTDVDNGLVAQVFIVQDNNRDFFIDQEGNKLSEVGKQVDLQHVIFQTMPTTSLTWSDGTPRYRANEKDKAEQYSMAWRTLRKDLFDSPQGQYTVYQFDVSKGIAIEGDEKNHVGDLLVPEKKIFSQEGLIQISETGKIAHNGELVTVAKGRPMLQYGDTFQFLNNKKFSPEEAVTIYTVIQNMMNDLKEQASKGKGVRFHPEYSKFLQNVLYWKTKKNDTSNNQIYVDTSTLDLYLGGKKYAITDIDDSIAAISHQLNNTYNNVNKDSLTKYFHSKFQEYYMDGSELKTREWDNYQSYLLESKYPDGKNRSIGDTPLYTNVSKPTDAVPYSYKQKYSTLRGLELPMQEAPKVEPTTEVNKVGQYTLDGTTPNTFQLANGPVEFTGTIKDGNPYVKVQGNETIDKIAANKELMDNTIISTLKYIGKYDATESDKELALSFVAIRIADQLRREIIPEVKKEAQIVVETPLQRAKYIANSGSIKHYTAENFKEAANSDNIKFSKYLENIAEQAHDPLSNKGVTEIYGKELVSIAQELYPESLSLEDQETQELEALDLDIDLPNNIEWVIQEYSDAAPEIYYSVVGKEDVGNSLEDIEKFISEDRPGYNRFIPFLDSMRSAEKEVNKIHIKYSLKEDTYNPEDTSAPEDEYRKIGGEKEFMSPQEFEKFQEWHQKNIPNIPFEVLDHILTTVKGEKAWGVFQDGVAKFYKRAAKGTEYHEIFHSIWNAFVATPEQVDIVKEFKERKGQFTDRESGKKIFFGEATDRQVTERIADDFADFRLGKISKKSIGQRIADFFKNIIEFFKSFVSKPSLKDSLFKAIEKGQFKDETYPSFVKDSANEYRTVEGLSEQQTQEFVEDMTARAAQFIFGESKESLYDLQKITGSQLFDKIKALYENPKERKYQALGDNRWNALVQKTKENLRTMGIDIDVSDVVSINADEANRNDYAKEPFTLDPKKYSPYAIKLAISTLPETQRSTKVNINTSLPDRVISSIKGYKLVNFSKTFATLLDKLSNTTAIPKVVSQLFGLSKENPDYVRLFTRLGGDVNTGVLDFSKFKDADWRLFVNFMQTFTKQKPNSLIEYVSEIGTDSSRNVGEVYTAPANLFTAVRGIKDSWIENIKALAKNENSLIKYDKKNKYYKVDPSYSTKYPVKTSDDAIAFLSAIGIQFSPDVYSALNSAQRNIFSDSVNKIHAYLSQVQDIASLSGKTININGPLTKLAELINTITRPSQENTYLNVEQRRVNAYSENNASSMFENMFNGVQNIEELLQTIPQLNDVWSKNSVILKKGGLFFDKNGERIKSLKTSYIGGRNINGDKGLSTSKLSLGDRFVQQINQNLSGNYYILVPGDASIEWMLSMGNHIEYGANDNPTLSQFRKYLSDDIALALDMDNREHLKNVGSKGQELRFFKDILSPHILEQVNSLIKNNATQEQIEEFIDKNLDTVNKDILDYINNTLEETKNELLKTRQLVDTQDGKFSYSGLDGDFTKEQKLDKYNLTAEDLNSILKFQDTNYIINNIEFHKVLFGDPYQFAIKEKNGVSILDETKRIKSFLSPRRLTVDSPEFNTYLNQTYNKVGDISLQEGYPGYHLFAPYTNTITVKDVEIVGSLANEYPAYKNVNEADAASWIMDTTYREVKLKNGQWSKEAEDFHQWQLAYTRNRMSEKGLYKYTNDTLKKVDSKLISSPSPIFILDVLKPIVSGNKYGTNYSNQVLDKFSQMPVYYSMVEGKNMEQLYIKMYKDDSGYAIAESGRKVGIDEMHSLYNEDGSFNQPNEIFDTNTIVQVPWSIYGLQQENSYDDTNNQLTRGSQITKVATMDMFDNGEASDVVKQEYAKNNELLDKLHEDGYNTLLDNLGIEDLGDSFTIQDNTRLSESLEYEMLRRELPDNVKDTVQLDENGEFRIPFESSPAYVQIKNILYSMVDKAIVSPKVHGNAYVQTPVTMWEDAKEGRKIAIKTEDGYKDITKGEYEKLSPEDKKKVVLTSSVLKFYTKEDPYCEIMLPHWFRTKFKTKFKNDEELLKYLNRTEEGQSILRGIGFRIPTQASSSIEVFRVKGLLPQYMGKTVVVPSEITTKAGSDFDIDKLNMYLKSIYIDKNGDIRLAKYHGEGTRDFYTKVFDDTLEAKKIKRAELFEAADILTYGLEDPKGLVERYGSLLDVLLQDVHDGSEYSGELMKQMEKLGNEDIQSSLRNKFVDTMYRRSLENEYYDSLEKLITLPENFDRLVSPVSDGGLKKLSDKLDELKGINEGTIKNRLLNMSYMTNLRHAFMTAKRWVGIAAVNITGHSLAQKTKLYLDTDKFSSLPEVDQKWLGDGSINLPHNTTEVGGKQRASLSGKTVKGDSQYISDRLSGYATSFVDVSKDPYIFKLIYSDLLISTAMFMERMGIGENTDIFLNQPIIREYISYLDSLNTKNLYNQKNINVVQEKFPTDTTAKMDIDNLESNISTSKFTNLQNAEQQDILKEFLKYSKMAEYSFKFTQATNYDTTKFNSGDSFFKKESRTLNAQDKNIFSSPQDVLDKTFIGKQSNYTGLAMSAMGAVLTLEKDEFTDITNRVLQPYVDNQYLSKDNFDIIANKVKTSFLDYIIQTGLGLNAEISQISLGDKSIAEQLTDMQKKYPQNKLLKSLSIATGKRVDGAKTVKLNIPVREAQDNNLYTGYMRELRDNLGTRDFYYNLVITSILQGTYQSPVSIKAIVPIEDYSEITKQLISTLQTSPELQAFSNGAFERNNWRSDDIMQSINPKFFLRSEIPLGEDRSGNEIFSYYSTAFPTVESLGIKSNDRALLVLNEKYNSFYTNKDFLKIPAVVTDRRTGERISMANGVSVHNSTYVARKKKGDLSLNNFYGYKRVTYSDGTPLLNTDKDGNTLHIYKLINLWGDGSLVSEYYTDARPSVIDNGTIKTKELSDEDIINFYGGSKQIVVPLPETKKEVKPTQEDKETKDPCEGGLSF